MRGLRVNARRPGSAGRRVIVVGGSSEIGLAIAHELQRRAPRELALLGRNPDALARATALVNYYLRRNEVARRSHAKTWRAKHRGVKFLRL